MNSIENIDIKKSIDFLPPNFKNDKSYVSSRFNRNKINDTTIWQIPNFLSSDECDCVINSSNNNFEFLNYRKSWRLIALDKNQNLINIIKERLHQNNFINILNANDWVKPSGFSSNITWQKNTDDINTCLRINKYENTNFGYHRDASLTLGNNVRSNYSLIIYLNDNFEGGETKFMVQHNNENNFIHNGLTIKSELDLIKDNHTIFSIKPIKGMAVIFDHRILHQSNTMVGTKYVLRTELLCFGKSIDNQPQNNNFNSNNFNYKQQNNNFNCDNAEKNNLDEFFTNMSNYKHNLNNNNHNLNNNNHNLNNSLFKNNLLNNLENLTKILFRQAQLNELVNKHSSELYEICLSLRHSPEKITQFPLHLLNLLDNDIEQKIICSNLILDSRNSCKYEFSFQTPFCDKFELIKIASMFVLSSLTTDINYEFINEFNKQFFGVNVGIICSNNNLNDNDFDNNLINSNLNNNGIDHNLNNSNLNNNGIDNNLNNNNLNNHNFDNNLNNNNFANIQNKHLVGLNHFSKSLGQYNLLDDNIPIEFINNLVKNIRIRKITTHDRTTFDLTNSIVINSKKFTIANDYKTNTKQNDYLTDNQNNIISILKHGQFNKNFGSGLHEVFKRLINYNGFNMENSIITEKRLTELMPFKPFSTIVTLIGAICSLDIHTIINDGCYVCRQCDESYYKKDKVNIKTNNAFCFYKFNFKTNFVSNNFKINHILNFFDVCVYDYNNISGKIKCSLPSKYYNHAADCGCTGRGFVTIEKFETKCNSINNKKYVMLDYILFFSLKHNKLTINYIPEVVI